MIGQSIRILRTAKGTKAYELAASTRISTAYLSLIEAGQRQPSMAVLRRISTALDVPFATLVLLGTDDEESMTTTSEVAERLANTLRRMAEAEGALKSLLSSNGKPKDASKRRQS